MRIEKIGLPLAIITLLISLTATLSTASQAAEIRNRPSGDDSLTTVSDQAWGRLEYLNWREYDDGGRQAKDAGPRVSAGASRSYNRDDLTFTPRVGAMIGYTYFEGTLGSPSNGSIDTYSKTFGFDTGADLGVIHRLRGAALVEPFLGLGYNWWRYDTASWGGPRETWDSTYVRAGARGSADLKVGDNGFRGYGELGLKKPISTQNSIKLAGHGKAALKPQGEISAFAEAGIMINKWRLGLAYDSWRFRQSEPVAFQDGTRIVQRKSQADIFSLTAGYTF